MRNIIDFVKLTIGTVGGAIAVLMLLGVISLPAKAHHGLAGDSIRFVECVSEDCKDKGQTGLFTKMVVSAVEDSPAVIVWLQGGRGRAYSLNFGPIEHLSNIITTVGVDVGYQIMNDKKMPNGDWGGPGRWSKDYVARVKSVVLWAHEQFGKPVFIMGHSAGAQGVSGYLLMQEDNQTLVSGAIWSGGNQSAPYPGKRGLEVQQFNIPALIIHHEKDRCPSTSYRAAKKRYKKYTDKGMNAGPTYLVKITGGEETWKGPGKDPRGCGVQADAHGFTGVKDVFTQEVLKFIMKYAGQQ